MADALGYVTYSYAREIVNGGRAEQLCVQTERCEACEEATWSRVAISRYERERSVEYCSNICCD